MSKTYILTFEDKTSYENYKKEVSDNGGIIKNDLGSVVLGFTAVIPPAFVTTILGNLQSSGIASFEPDSEVRIA